MTFAFGHIIGAWLLGKIYEWTFKKKISSPTWIFLLIGAILPDIDYLIDWTLGTDIHRTITHSILFAILAPLGVYFFLSVIGNPQKKILALAFDLGLATHLLLDILGGGYGIPLFWPGLF